MDEMDGHEFCRKIKENKDFLHIPFIFLTAKNREEDKLKGFSEGAIYYINKPFKIEEVKAEIKSLLESRERHTEHIRKKIGDRIMDIFHDTKQLENENQYNMKILNMYEKYNLTRREREIVGLLRNGLLNKEISIALNISQKTVEVHLYNIFRKIGVQNRVELLNLLYK